MALIGLSSTSSTRVPGAAVGADAVALLRGQQDDGGASRRRLAALQGLQGVVDEQHLGRRGRRQRRLQALRGDRLAAAGRDLPGGGLA
jgi:hypothetical protein